LGPAIDTERERGRTTCSCMHLLHTTWGQGALAP